MLSWLMRNIVFKALAEAARSGEPVALGVITGVKGSSPQKVGAKALFYADGRIKGTLGGGCLEAEIQQRAVQSLRTGQGATFDLLLDHDFGWDDGLMCGGKVCGVILPNAQSAGEQFWSGLAERKQTTAWGVKGDHSITRVPGGEVLDMPQGLGVRQSSGALGTEGIQKRQRTGALQDASATEAGDWLYREIVTAPCALWIAGAGHIAQAVAPLALQLDFSVTVFDDRPALANHQFFPREVSLQAEVWDKLLALPLPSAPSFGLIVTRGHRHDALVLKEWIHRPFRFLGMIGSARKARTIFEDFTEEKLATPEELARIACPVGVKIRSQTPQEIAVSIMAQFIDKRAELVYEKMAVAHDGASDALLTGVGGATHVALQG
jgi:xanthine dehydrogenase accessory factor